MLALCSSEQFTAYPSRGGIVILPTASADDGNGNRVLTSVGATALRPSHQIQPPESYPSESNNLFAVSSSSHDQFFVSTQQTEVRVGRLRYLAPAAQRRPQPSAASAAAAAASSSSSPMARRATSWTVDLSSDNDGRKKSADTEAEVTDPVAAATVDARSTLTTTTTKSTLDVTIKRTHPGGKVTALAVSPCGRYVASGAQDHNVVVWSCTPPAHTNFSVFKEHTATVTAIAFGSGFLAQRTTFAKQTPERRLMASGSSDGVVLVWDVVEQTVLHYLRQAARICFLAFMHAGDAVLAVNARAAPVMFYALDARSDDEIAAAAAADSAKAEASALELAQRGVCLAQRDTPFRLPPLCFGATSSDEPIAANHLLLVRDPPPLSSVTAAVGSAPTFSVIVAREDGAAWRIKIPERLSAIRSYDDARKIASTNLRTIPLGAAFRHVAAEQPPRNAAECPQPKHNVIVLRPPPASSAARPQPAQAFCCDVLFGANAASSLIGVRVADRVAICRYDDGSRLGVLTDIGVGAVFAFCGVGDGGESDGNGAQLPHPVVGKARDMQAVATIGYAVVRCGRGSLTFYALHEKEVAEIHVIAGVVNSKGEVDDEEQARGGTSRRSKAMQRERVAAMSPRRWLLAVTRPGDVSLFLTDQLAGRTRPRQAAVLHLGREAAAPIAAVTSLAQFRQASAAVQRVRALAFLSGRLSDDAVGDATSCSFFAAVVTEEDADADADADVADAPLSATASTWVFLCAIIATATGCSMRPLARMRLPAATDGGVSNDAAQSVSLAYEEGGEGDDGAGQLRVRFVFSEVDVMLDGLLDDDDDYEVPKKNTKALRKPPPLQRDVEGNSFREISVPLAITAWEPVLARTRPETYNAVLRAFGEVWECKTSLIVPCYTFCTALLQAGGSGGIASLCRLAFESSAGFSRSPDSFDETAKDVARALQLRAASVAMRAALPEGAMSSGFIAQNDARWRQAVERACSGSTAPAAAEEPRAEFPRVTMETLEAASRRLWSLVSLAPALLRVAPVWSRSGSTGGSAVDAADVLLAHAIGGAFMLQNANATSPAATVAVPAAPVEVLAAFGLRLLDAAYEVGRHLFALQQAVNLAAEYNEYWQPCVAASNAAVRELAAVYVAEACCAERTAIVRDLLRGNGGGDAAIDARMMARLTAAASRRKGEAARVEIVDVDGRPMKRITRRREQAAAAATAENDDDDNGESETAMAAMTEEHDEEVEMQALLPQEQFAALFEHQFEVVLQLASQDMKTAALQALQRRFVNARHQCCWLPPGDHPALLRSRTRGSGTSPIRESSIVSRSWLHAPPPLDIESVTVVHDDEGDDDDALPHCRFGGLWRRCTVKRRVGVAGDSSTWCFDQPALLHAFAASTHGMEYALEKQLRSLCHAVDGVEQVLCEVTLTRSELHGIDPFSTEAKSMDQYLYSCLVVAAPAGGVGGARVPLPSADMPAAMQRLRSTLRQAYDCWARWLSRGASDQTLPLHFIAARTSAVFTLSANTLLRPAAADFARAFAVSTAGGAARISVVDVVGVAFCTDAFDAIDKCFASAPPAAALSEAPAFGRGAVDMFALAASSSSSSSLEALMQLATLRAHRHDRRFAAAINGTLALVPDAAELTDDVLEMRLHERHFERAAGTFEQALAGAVHFYNSFRHVCERNRQA